MTRTRVLLAGESWVSAAVHHKGWDHFGSVTFHLGAEPLVAALADSPFDLHYMPAHEAAERFPAHARGARAIRRGDPLRSRLQHAAAAPRRVAHGQAGREPPEAAARVRPRRRRADDDRRLLQLPGHQWRRPLPPHGGRGGAAGRLPALRRSDRGAGRLPGRDRRPQGSPDPRRDWAANGRSCSACNEVRLKTRADVQLLARLPDPRAATRCSRPAPTAAAARSPGPPTSAPTGCRRPSPSGRVTRGSGGRRSRG